MSSLPWYIQYVRAITEVHQRVCHRPLQERQVARVG